MAVARNYRPAWPTDLNGISAHARAAPFEKRQARWQAADVELASQGVEQRLGLRRSWSWDKAGPARADEAVPLLRMRPGVRICRSPDDAIYFASQLRFRNTYA